MWVVIAISDNFIPSVSHLSLSLSLYQTNSTERTFSWIYFCANKVQYHSMIERWIYIKWVPRLPVNKLWCSSDHSVPRSFKLCHKLLISTIYICTVHVLHNVSNDWKYEEKYDERLQLVRVTAGRRKLGRNMIDIYFMKFRIYSNEPVHYSTN